MAADNKSAAWVTYAVTEEDVPKALTLCFSLKQLWTTRKIAVLVSKTLPFWMKETLFRSFDLVVYIEEERNTGAINKEDFAKLSALTLTCFRKCVVLPPTTLAVQKCDQIFSEPDAFQSIWSEDSDAAPIFLIRPSLKSFDDVMNAVSNQPGPLLHGIQNYLKNYGGKALYLNVEYGWHLSVVPPRNNLNIRFVDVANTSFDADLEKFGFFSKLILQQRNTIYDEFVKPRMLLMGNTKNVSPSETNIFPRLVSKNEPIAIIGVSCRYPGANNLDELWNILINGQDATGTPPDFRWLKNQSVKHGKHYFNTNGGFLREPVDEFDAKFFGISPVEMVCMDPQQRILLQLAWEALEDAAIDPTSLKKSLGGVFVGPWAMDYKDIVNASGKNDFFRSYMGNSIGVAAARISFLLGLTGPSIATESGCSSSMVAVHLACQSLRNGESSFALACGVNLILEPYDKDKVPMALSPDGRCKTFDSSANGFGRAEGAGVLVLKRVTDAIQNGDHIWGLIRGSGVAQEGVSNSLGTPTVHCESLAMSQALQDADIDPSIVSYMEAHGTGTIVGDPIEVKAIANAYHSENRKEPLLIGSLKTNIGHTESCSGIAGIMKVILAMKHELIPPHINFNQLNPEIDLDAVPAKIPLSPVEWKKTKGKPRFAGVSSFGITGTDAHVILEEPPSSALQTDVGFQRPVHIMKVNAKTEEAYSHLLGKYLTHLKITNESFEDLCYTANVGRADFNQRAALIATSNEDAVKIIEQNKLELKDPSITLGKLCFLFTGQGSQYRGMGKQFYDTSPVFRMHFEYCEKILQDEYNLDIKQVLWAENDSQEISRTVYSQTSIFCVEYALTKLWESWGITPDFVLGHSLGEFAAAVCAGLLSVEDALKLVAERSILIDSLPAGKMLVIKANKEKVDSLLQKFAVNNQNPPLDYAAINSNEQTVLAGDTEVLLAFSEYCKKSHLECMVLQATHAFHSKHMDPILNKYRKVAQSVKICKDFKCQFISGSRGTLVSANEIDAEYWVQQTREAVLFLSASKKSIELGCNVFIEVGPQPILSALTEINNEGKDPILCLPSLRKGANEWNTILNALGRLYVNGLNVDWKGVDNFYQRKKINHLPKYPFIGKKFWPEVSVNLGEAEIHPLLGHPISNATDKKLFQTGLNLKELGYIKDHCIGDNIILPGACLLEMCLAAGLATMSGSSEFTASLSTGVKVEELEIEAALGLSESTTCHVQTVTELTNSHVNGDNSNVNLSIQIFRRLQSEKSKWKRHAQAKFSLLSTAEERRVQFDTQNFLKTINTQGQDAKQLWYDKLPAIGLMFGPSFKSISLIWSDVAMEIVIVKLDLTLETRTLSDYALHPLVIDGMMQALSMLYLLPNVGKTLYVPTKIGKFVWLSGTPNWAALKLYIHVSYEGGDKSKGTAILVDSKGTPLALMSSLEITDTTLKVIEASLEEQSKASQLPQMWEEIWKKTSPLAQLNLEATQASFYTPEFQQNFEAKFNNPPRFLTELFCSLEKLVYLNILRALYELGWKPDQSQTFEETPTFLQLRILPSYRKYFGFMFEILEKQGILARNDLSSRISWKVANMPAPYETVISQLSSPELSDNLTQTFRGAGLLFKVGESLSSFLKGTLSPLSTFFQEGPKSYPSLAEFYQDYEDKFMVPEFQSVLTLLITHLRDAQTRGELKIKVLEIGAGTGYYSQLMLNALEISKLPFEYTFTDISPSFFSAAQAKFEKHKPSIIYKKLNIEEDPIEQGFTPDYYDLVFGGDVIHATRSILESLGYAHMLLRPHGRLVLAETTAITSVTTFLVGTLEGYWRFEDFELREKHCLLEKQKWVQLLSPTFTVEGTFSIFDNSSSLLISRKLPQSQKCSEGLKTWLVFHPQNHPISNFLSAKIGGVTGRNVVQVLVGAMFQEDSNSSIFTIRSSEYDDFARLVSKITTEGTIEGLVYCWSLNVDVNINQEQLVQPYFNLCKSILKLDLSEPPRFIVLTSGVVPIEDNDLSNFSASAFWGFARSFKNENFHINHKCLEIDEGAMSDSTYMEEIFHEIWNTDMESQVALLKGSRWVPRLHSHNPMNSELSLPRGSFRFQLIKPATHSISELEFGPLDIPQLGAEDVEVQVKAFALNFRDIFCVTLTSPAFMKTALGNDFAGVVKRVGSKVTKWRVGDNVFGCNLSPHSMPCHVETQQDLLLAIPNNYTYWEAATIPIVYLTSVVSLLEQAKIQPGETVLIHSASGGLGLSAIEICKNVGCNIICTVGNPRKVRYLRGLGIQHIFHSRNTNFGNQILEVTNGRGVDVVLNSLTSAGFKEATLEACAKGARFVELGKLNIWEPHEVKERRPDVKYCVVDLSISLYEKKVTRRWFQKLETLIEQNIVKPLPYILFGALHIRQALDYMQRTKHIGKVVCIMPEICNEGGELKTYTPMFNDKSSYLITGGLGGIGFEVCKWMLKKGAKNILLAGRSQASPSIQKLINQLNDSGANLKPVRLDVGNFEDCRNLLTTQLGKLGLPPLRGVMHAAGTLADGLVVNQDWEVFSTTFKPKIRGTLNLHELTKHLNLEHFVLYSSTASMIGLAGQSNHAAANAFEDAFAHYRHSIGLPATTINWGQWGEVGVAKELDIPGLSIISNTQGINGLEYAMKTQQLHLSILNVESFVGLSKISPGLPYYLNEGIWKNSLNSNSNQVVIKSDDFWKKYETACDLEGRLSLLKEQLRNILRDTLKIEENEMIDDETSMQELGVDSLMFVQIRNSIQVQMRDRLLVSASTIRDFNSVKALAEKLVELIEQRSSGDKGATKSVSKGDVQPNQHIYSDNSSSLVSYYIHTPDGSVAGAPLFIAHGAFGSRLNWDLIAETISNATKRVVVTFDARYHGDSPSVGEFTYETMAQDVFNLARHLGMEKFSVMGHSMGGKTAMTFALLYPSHVEKLVSIDVSPLEQSYLPTTKFDYLSALQQVVIQSEQSPMTLLQAKTLADNALKELGCEATNRNHLVANFVSKDSKIVWAGTPDLDLVRQSFPVLRAFPKGLLTREFKQPTLFMKCENSSYIPYSTFPEIQETFVNAKFGIIHNSGHFPHIENTTQFMDVLLEFLNSN